MRNTNIEMIGILQAFEVTIPVRALFSVIDTNGMRSTKR